MKRLLAFAIAVMMVFAMVPVSVSAAEILPTPAAVDGVLTLGEGTYRICTSHSSLDGITEIVGAGVGKTKLQFFDNGGEFTAIHLRKGDRTVKISDLTIDGSIADNPENKAERGIVTENCNVALIIENCEFKNLTSGVYFNGASNVTITNCTFTDCSWSAIGTDLTSHPDANVIVKDCTFTNVGEEGLGWLGGATIRIENAKGLDKFVDYGPTYATLNSPTVLETNDGYGLWTRGANGALEFTDITPAPTPDPEEDEEEEATPNFFLFMFMKRLLTEYAVELVYDDTMGIVEVDDEDGYVRFSKDAVITVAALEGCEVESVLVNGEAVELDEDGTYTIKRIRKDAKVEVTFAEIVEEEIEDAE